MTKLKETLTPTYKRIVIKFGTSLLTGGNSFLDKDFMADLVKQVAELHQQGKEIILVSSGAITAGKDKLGLSKKLKDIPYKQVCSSVGQARLMNLYEDLFTPYNITIAQGLLTKTIIRERSGYLNTRNTLLALMELGVICIINENDMVSVDEIQEAKFGDNDNLSAMVANLVDADLLLILTEVDGLFTADPHNNPAAKLISEVANINSSIENLASGTINKLGTGGMVTKIEAARLATDSGVTVIIANGRQPDILLSVTGDVHPGTRFNPAAGHLDSRDRWMLSGLSVKGKITVDAGAGEALKKQKRSLLAAGILNVEGKFLRGDLVKIHDPSGLYLGCGITNYCASDIDTIKGMHSRKITSLLSCDYGAEVIHRNNLVIL